MFLARQCTTGRIKGTLLFTSTISLCMMCSASNNNVLPALVPLSLRKMPDEPTHAAVCRICRTRKCPDLIRTSAAQAVCIRVGMMSCQVEQACLFCREVARLHEVVQGRMTAGTFVQQACAESIADSGPHKVLVSVVLAAQVCPAHFVSL